MVPHDAELRQGSRKFKIGEKSFNGYEHNKLWANNGNGTFTEVGFATGSDIIVDCRSCVVADFDRDGRLDLAVRTMYERSFFLRNQGTTGHFIDVRLVGTRSNRMGVGTRVEVLSAGKRQIQELACGAGFLSQHESALHFGLGKAERIERISLRWPSGETQEFADLPANRFLIITEGDPELQIETPRPKVHAEAPPPSQDPYVLKIKSARYLGVHGDPVSITELWRDVTLVHVWSPSCLGCEKEAATLERLHRISEKGPFTVLAIAINATVEEVRAFVEDHGLTYPVVVADETTSKMLMQIPQVPWTFVARGGVEVGSPGPEIPSIPWSGLIDTTGFIRRYRGPIKLFEARLDIASALATEIGPHSAKRPE